MAFLGLRLSTHPSTTFNTIHMSPAVMSAVRETPQVGRIRPMGDTWYFFFGCTHWTLLGSFVLHGLNLPTVSARFLTLTHNLPVPTYLSPAILAPPFFF
jgi:hypothetical protein